MPKKSRRLVSNDFVSQTGVIVKIAYCRKCMQNKHPKEFYKSVNLIDSNGLMSICKDCCKEIYDNNYLRERTLPSSLYATCRDLNISYDEEVVDSVRSQISNTQESGKTPWHTFALYIARLLSMRSREFGKRGNSSATGIDLTFATSQQTISKTDSPVMPDEIVSQDDFWGGGFTVEQLDYLEKEYANFKNSYTIEGHASDVLLRQAVKKMLEIKETEEDGKSSAKTQLEKGLMALFKELAISPAHASASSSGKNKDTFGCWIEDIEQKSPAEWLEEDGKELFHDVDNIERYYDNFVVRAIKNFFAGVPDYTIVDENGNSSDWSID